MLEGDRVSERLILKKLPSIALASGKNGFFEETNDSCD